MTKSTDLSGRLRIFVALYAAAFAADLTESWEWPVAGSFFLLLGAWTVLSTNARRALFVFALAGAGYTSVFQFPDVGNHDNLILFLNLFFVVSILVSWIYGWTDQKLFAAIQSPLRVVVILVYVWAGFAKLNTDFFHHEVGCAADFATNAIEAFHIPVIAITPPFAFGIAAFVLMWEIGGGVALLFRRLQLPVLVLCIIVHAVLAQLIFFDFTALAFALLLMFVPDAQWHVLAQKATFQCGALRIRRGTLYFACFAVATCTTGLLLWSDPGGIGHHRWQVLAIDGGYLFVVWPVVSSVWHGETVWRGTPVWSGGAPRWTAVLPLVVCLWALQPYVGLRTAGSFTMFSNLRTEGLTSNHLLLASNPLKVWSYQEDVVEVVRLDARHARNSQERLSGHKVPLVELKKRILTWKERELPSMKAELRYRGKNVTTEDIVADNPWGTTDWSLEMYLLDFRKIQTDGVNRCRW